MEAVQKPKREVQQIETRVNMYKPVSDHAHNVSIVSVSHRLEKGKSARQKSALTKCKPCPKKGTLVCIVFSNMA